MSELLHMYFYDVANWAARFKLVLIRGRGFGVWLINRGYSQLVESSAFNISRASGER